MWCWNCKYRNNALNTVKSRIHKADNCASELRNHIKTSYQIQEHRPSHKVPHNVLRLRFFMSVWSKCYKQICSSHG